MKMKMLTVMAAGLISVSALAAASKPVFYPAAPEQPRLQFLKAINGANVFLNSSTYGNRFPGYEPQAQPETNPIRKPYGMATTAGKVFVCDMGASVVKVFDLEKKFVTEMGAGKLGLPLNIAIDSDGTRYVADAKLNKIAVFDSNNVFVKMIGNPAKMQPSDLTITNGHLYVTDVKNSQVVVIDPKNGKEINRISQAGIGANDLFKATNLTSDASGNIVVADTVGGKLSKFTADGTLVKTYGSLGDAVGQFVRPKGVAVDRENRVYAVDNAFENVQIFSEDGKLLLPFGNDEQKDGEGLMNMPVKVVVDYNNVKYFQSNVAPGYAVEYLVYVTNQFGDNKVNVYGFLKQK